MHVVMIVDEERYHREHRMLDSLAHGMVKHGWRVSRVLPFPVVESVEVADAVSEALGHDHAYPPHTLPWQRRMQIKRWPEQLLAADLVFGIGLSTWRWAADFGRIADAAVVLDVWSAQLVRRAHRPKADSRINGYMVCTEPLARAMARQVGSDLVSYVPYGVSIDDHSPRSAPREGSPISIAMIDAGLDIGSYQAVLGAVRRLISEGMNLQLVVELRGPQEHTLWQYAQQLELLDHVASVADAASCRSLIVRCDLLLLPDRFGQMRSIILEAMACGVPIVAANDPMIDVLQDGQTALIVGSEDPEAWLSQIRKLLTNNDLYASISQAGVDHVVRNHSLERQLAGVIRTVETAVSGSAIAFDGPSSSEKRLGDDPKRL